MTKNRGTVYRSGKAPKWHEIEFVCVNSEVATATDPKAQVDLYRALIELPGVYVLWQDWSEGEDVQVSLSAIYRGSRDRKIILHLAQQYGVAVDLEEVVNENYVDRIVRREHPGQITEPPIQYSSVATPRTASDYTTLYYLGSRDAGFRGASKLVMWHGTSTGPDGEILHSILKVGLLPDPKKKAYESPYSDDDDYGDGYDLDTEESMELDESLGGAYLTNWVGEALRYSKHAIDVHGGGHVLVAAQIETQDTEVKIDEDFLINYVWEFVIKEFEPVDFGDIDIDEVQMLKWLEQDADYTQIGRAWIAKQFPHVTVPEPQMAKVMPHLVEALRSIMIMTFFKTQWARVHAIAYNAEEDQKIADAIESLNLGYDLMDVDEIDERQRARRSYKDAIRQVSDLLKAVTIPPRDSRQHNVRILKPVGYRGANRILAVASWGNLNEHGTASKEAILHYGQDSAVVDQLIKAIGANKEWVDARSSVRKVAAGTRPTASVI